MMIFESIARPYSTLDAFMRRLRIHQEATIQNTQERERDFTYKSCISSFLKDQAVSDESINSTHYTWSRQSETAAK